MAGTVAGAPLVALLAHARSTARFWANPGGVLWLASLGGTPVRRVLAEAVGGTRFHDLDRHITHAEIRRLSGEDKRITGAALEDVT